MSAIHTFRSHAEFRHYIELIGISSLFQGLGGTFIVTEPTNTKSFALIISRPRIVNENDIVNQCNITSVGNDENFNTICRNAFPPEINGRRPDINIQQGVEFLSRFIADNLVNREEEIRGGMRRSRRRRRREG